MKYITDILDQVYQQEDGLQKYVEAVRIAVGRDRNVLIQWNNLTLITYLVDQDKLPLLHPHFIIYLASAISFLQPSTNFIDKFKKLCNSLKMLADQQDDTEKSLAAIYALCALNKKQILLMGMNSTWQTFLTKHQLSLNLAIMNIQTTHTRPSGKRWELLTMAFGSVCRALGDFVSDGANFKKLGFKYTKLSVEAGNLEAQYDLANCYRYGEGTKNNLQQAYHHFILAAKRGCSDSQYALSQLYRNGSIAKDAFLWCQSAAEKNNFLAQFELARDFTEGNGTTQDLHQAVFWCRCAAEQNYPQAQFFLACCFGSGDGVEKDERQAFLWLLRAAEQGHPTAQYLMAANYSRGIPSADDELAMVWSALAAADGTIQNATTLYEHLFKDERRVALRLSQMPSVNFFAGQRSELPQPSQSNLNPTQRNQM